MSHQVTVSVSDATFDALEEMRVDRRNQNRSEVVEDGIVMLYGRWVEAKKTKRGKGSPIKDAVHRV